jgi:methionyl-tRNA formyltransferase
VALRVLFAGNKHRGIACLDAIIRAGHTVVSVLAHPGAAEAASSVATAARAHRLPVLEPSDVNDAALIGQLSAARPDVALLAGFSPIVGTAFLSVCPRGCFNLHGGKLPSYRGSSPMNWALINGDTSFSIAVIRVDRGVDTGPIVAERTFPIAPDDTIADLQRQADEEFPKMVVEVLRQVEAGSLSPREQSTEGAAYYPLRFPDDGFILWDQLTAAQVHNRVRALTEPYPCAFSFVGGRRVRLLRSKLPAGRRHGEPGRVYLKSERGLLVCASDRCLWIERAIFDDNSDAVASIPRYAQLATVRSAALDFLRQRAR